MRTELEVQKEKLGMINHQLGLCMKEQEILEDARKKIIEKIRILEAGP